MCFHDLVDQNMLTFSQKSFLSKEPYECYKSRIFSCLSMCVQSIKETRHVPGICENSQRWESKKKLKKKLINWNVNLGFKRCSCDFFKHLDSSRTLGKAKLSNQDSWRKQINWLRNKFARLWPTLTQGPAIKFVFITWEVQKLSLLTLSTN